MFRGSQQSLQLESAKKSAEQAKDIAKAWRKVESQKETNGRRDWWSASQKLIFGRTGFAQVEVMI